MNFYQAQDQARKQSRLLVALFALAVVFLVLITNISIAFFVLYSDPSYSLNGHVDPSLSATDTADWFKQLAQALGWKKSVWISALVCGVIFMAMGFKWFSLRQGGKVVAESLGGTLIQPSSRIAAEKQLLNVVEEIALASGTPVPQVYILKSELGINAFAAGLSPEDAVIGITHGALASFNREQLQGVIAHEFSHILNGDMRLNMKLVAVLHGILMIAEGGRFFMKLGYGNGRSVHRHRDNKAGGAFVALGVCLWLIGLLGQFLGAMIKAAVSRQREFLADASAVQFTRNPEGIADALSIIGGLSYQSKLRHHAAHELGHLFFSNANSLEQSSAFLHPSRWAFLSTHPPLSERITRIQPKWSGRFIKQTVTQEAGGIYDSPTPSYPSFSDIQSKDMSAGLSNLSSGNEVPGSAASTDTHLSEHGATTNATQNIESNALPKEDTYRYVEFEADSKKPPPLDAKPELTVDVVAELMALSHEVYDASLIIIALLMSDEPEFYKKQTEFITQTYPENSVLRHQKIEQLYNKTKMLNAQQILNMVELLVSTLKNMSSNQYKIEKALLIKLIQVDGQVDVFEWLIFQLIKQHLDRHFGISKPVKAKYKTLKSLAPLFEIVLSRVVHYGFEDMPDAEVDQQDKRLVFIRASDVAGLTTMNLLDLSQCSGKNFSQAVHKLSLAYPLLKPRIIKGLLAAIHFDQDITDKERYVITAIAAVMDCPLIGLDLRYR